MKQRALQKKSRVMFVLGTRPEIIKIAPVIHTFKKYTGIDVVIVSTTQQADLIPAFLENFEIKIDYELNVMVPDQSLNRLLAQSLSALDHILSCDMPDAVVVQGDTSTAVAGALAARMRAIPVIHIEAGLRTGDQDNPFPEETNRKLITQMASLHCAATSGNKQALLQEGISEDQIQITGNPVVNALQYVRQKTVASDKVTALLSQYRKARIVILTTHRRESFGPIMEKNLKILREFVTCHPDIVMIVPVHPNPIVKKAVHDVLSNTPGVVLIDPLDYPDFITLLKHAWLVISDSGGIQEEVASLGKPLLILRANTERPEIVTMGLGRVVGQSAHALETALAQTQKKDSWVNRTQAIANPFGDSDSSLRITRAIIEFLANIPRDAVNE